MKTFITLALALSLACFGVLAEASHGFEDPKSDTAASPDQVALSQAHEEQRLCPDQTATRIKHRRGTRCMSPGRVYTREQLRSTGAVDNAEALSRLDPSIRTSGRY